MGRDRVNTPIERHQVDDPRDYPHPHDLDARHWHRPPRAHRGSEPGPDRSHLRAHAGARAFGPGRGWFRGMPLPGGLRARRGDVRSAILGLLAEEPMHGYQIISELERRSDGRWRPSAGSVYPTLQQLEDEGLVRASEKDGRRVFELTDTGRTAADTASTGRSGAPWAFGGGSDAVQLRDLLHQVMAATLQLSQVGSAATTAEARKLLVETRRGLYRLLAEDDGGSADAPSPEAPPAE